MNGEVRVRAPGKVNLHLAVGARDADGYHPLATIFHAVDLYETVTARTREDGQFTVTVDANPALAMDPQAVPLDHTNIAVKAAQLVAQRFGIDAGVDLHIDKGIPVAGGMAGGSADAAAALVACAQLWHVGASRQDLVEMAASLGADVPFALMGHTAVGLGRGDQLSPALTHGEFHWVFATDSAGLSTPAVYAEFDRHVAEGMRVVGEPRLNDALMAALMAGDAQELATQLHNDLEGPALALAPHLRATMDLALEADAMGVMVSGSGPTIAALARSRQHALAIAAHVRAWGQADAVLTATGPAGGTAILDGA